MPMNMILREKRKALGLTQGQVAEELGVSPPAVSKWESGAVCPDIALLPALARLLQTDPNTLLCFQEEPSKQEIQHFCQKISAILQEKKGLEGFQESCRFMEQKLQEYPRCSELLHIFALTLDGALLMSALTPEEKMPYEELAASWYLQVTELDDADLKIMSAHMLAVKYMKQEEYEKAQELIDLLPKHNILDKQLLQADLYLKQKANLKEAEKLIQRKLYNTVMDLNGILIRHIKVLLAEEEPEKADQVAKINSKAMELLGFGTYFTHIAPLETALARKDKAESLRLIQALFDAVFGLGKMSRTPLYDQLLYNQISEDQVSAILIPLTAHLEQAPEYDFLREETEFQELLKRYKRLL